MVRTLVDEVRARDPLLVFLAETKASANRIKEIQSKLDFTQGIVVPSNEVTVEAADMLYYGKKVPMLVLRVAQTPT